MNQILTTLLLVLFVVLSFQKPSSDGRTIDTVAEFDAYVESSSLWTPSPRTPTVDPEEVKKWMTKVVVPDMKNKSCFEKMTFLLIHACGGMCKIAGRHDMLAAEACKDVPLTDTEIQGACCPDMLPTRTPRTIRARRQQ